MKCFIFFLIVLLVPVCAVYSQSGNKKSIKQCDALLARQIVERQADFSKTLDQTDQRINVLIKIADFLWASDELTARVYFAEAYKIAVERFREKGLERKENKGLITEQPDYRFRVISQIAKRDADWAKKLSEQILKEFDEDKEKEKRSEYDRNREARELLGIAANVAKDNPNLALSLARRVMRYPLSSNWYFTLFEMALNNQALADQIYAEALANYADAEVFRLLYLSAYPFGNQRIFGIEKNTLGASVPINFSPNTNLKRQFLLALLRRVSALTPESTEKSLQTSTPDSAVAVIALNELEPIVAQQLPDLMPMFAQAKVRASSVASNEIMEAANKQNETYKGFNKSFDERLKELEKADAEGKLTDGRIIGLLNSAKKEEEFKLAETWLDKISEAAPREEAGNYFYFRRSKLASEENRFDDARKFAEKITKIELRAVVYFDIAEAGQKNVQTKQEALDSLLEVYKMAQKAPDSIEKAQIFLGLAFMYEKVDHFSALDALSAAIKTANKLENPNLFTSWSSQQINAKDYKFFASYDVPGFDIKRTFYEISQKDFQAAIGQAESFSDKYLRALAVLASVKDCEKNEPAENLKPKRNKPKQN